jgi:NAD(P)-dependent dehydrogenase (short-subunit alcohol dehydrogenase family)
MPTAIVTGGNSGIGRATAVALAERGFDVGITWHTERERADSACEEIRALGVRAEAAQMDLDVMDPNELPGRAAAIDELTERLGGIDAFVNNHGAGQGTPFLDTDLETFARVVNLDLTGSFVCLQKAARRMVQQGRGGRLIAITSVHEHVPLEGSASYTASKHGLGGLVKVMALELAEHGITVNAVAPGEIATRMTGQEDEDPRAAEREGVPAGRPGHAREIGEAVAYLASPGARYTTGHSLVVDGGMLLMAAMANQLAS